MLNMREVVRSRGGQGTYILESYEPSQTFYFDDQDSVRDVECGEEQ